ncbi:MULTISPECIES: hypothetical protein [Pseudomonas]|uniref:hypothetical protein n=1 Tax=Pseudomonas TaxID=286 RepID=UPI002B4126AF|nr:hypothetical protein [Pseudomonas sichuanensis]
MTSAINKFSAFSQRNMLLGKGFLGGVAMAAPFYAEFFSWRWAALLTVPLFLLIVLSLIRGEKVKKPPLAILPMVLLLMLHAVALVFSHTMFAGQVVKDLLIASFLLFIYVLADEDTLSGFFSALIPLALVSALIGLVKAALLDRGYLLGFMLESCASYPAGSALCINYNNLGLFWLAAALGCIKMRLWWALPFLIAAGALSSSRRFIVLMVFLPIIWVMVQGRSAVVKSVIVAIFSALLIYAVSDPVSFARFQHGDLPYTVLSIGDAVSLNGVSINRSTPGVMLSTMGDGTGGTGSRIKFWSLGLSMVSWLPQGWGYHQVFSCTFSPCDMFHYPHMPVISEWVIGGVVFALVALAFYIWPFWLVLRQRQTVPIALFLIALPYSLISGDTVFSLPICLACMFAALSCVPRRVAGTP